MIIKWKQSKKVKHLKFCSWECVKTKDAVSDIFIYEESALYRVTKKHLHFRISQNWKVIGIVFMRADTGTGARHSPLWLNECKW